MQTDEQNDPNQEGKPDGAGSPERKPTPPAGAPNDGGNEDAKTVTIAESDLAEYKRLAEDGQNYKGGVARLEQENSELKSQVEELSKTNASSPILGVKPENVSDEEAKSIERDFKRQSKDLLSEAKELAEFTPIQRREFDKEYQLRSSLAYQESLQQGDLVPVSALKKSISDALRFVKGSTQSEELRKARLAGQKDMMDKDAGNIANTAQSSTEKKVGEISAEAIAAAEKSLLVQDGVMTKEEMAKRIQKRIDEGK